MTGQVYDVIVVGGGMVGTALAVALASQSVGRPLRIALIEARAPTAMPEIDQESAFEPRVSALTQASRQLFRNIGVWSHIARQRHGLMQNMTVWDADGTGHIEFRAEDIGQSELGFIVENHITVAALFERLQDFDNIDLIAPARIEGLSQYHQGQRTVFLDDGRELSAHLVVGADGAMSRVRELAGISHQEKSYQQSAIVTTVKTEQPHQHTAWQRFLETGPLAFLPLRNSDGDDHSCSIVWSLDDDELDAKMALDDDAFSVVLARAFENRLGDITAVDKRFAFPLRQRHADQYVQHGLALVGDAAHTIHPLAGQGVNLGLMDVAVLTEELMRASQRQLGLGDLCVLQRYQRRRRGDNAQMMGTMSGFKLLFGESALPVRWLRNTGMNWLNELGPVKNRVAANAMGLSGDLPALVKPDFLNPSF
ncbi:MAG: UbiH/UbiF/VisC/COQ6 family ubiquinone biosynthesis hydroxylase [Pseudomonadales bacterium]